MNLCNAPMSKTVVEPCDFYNKTVSLEISPSPPTKTNLKPYFFHERRSSLIIASFLKLDSFSSQPLSFLVLSWLSSPRSLCFFHLLISVSLLVFFDLAQNHASGDAARLVIQLRMKCDLGSFLGLWKEILSFALTPLDYHHDPSLNPLQPLGGSRPTVWEPLDFLHKKHL